MTVLREIESTFKLNDEKFSERNIFYNQTYNELKEALFSAHKFIGLFEIDFLDQIR